MIKLTGKCVLLAAVAALAVSVATPSFAAKKASKKAAAPAACTMPKYQTASCANGWCKMNFCGLDGKMYHSMMVCWEPACPKG